MDFQTMTATSQQQQEQQQQQAQEEEDDNSSNDETGTQAPDELRTYIIIVNDDGSLSLDPNGVIADDADPQTVFPVSLPVNKMKSPDCPLPGATPVPGSSRNRKSKPQAVLYGGDNDDMYELNPTDTSSFRQDNRDFEGQLPVNGTRTIADDSGAAHTASAGSGTSIDIAQLEPQDIAILENVLQSESARELLENLELPSAVEMSPSPVISSHLWDHSYSTLSANIPTPPFANVSQPQTTVIDPVRKGAEKPKTSKPVQQSPTSVTSTTKPLVVQPTQRLSPAPLSPITTLSPNIRRTSECESAGNIRRSQRQQDRIERQEAERIMAENQQMMQREKELMLESSASPPVPKPVVETPPPPTPVNISPVVSQRTPEETRVASPLLQIQTPVRPSSPESTSKLDRRPTRQRKLPAHLADPNYVQFEEDTKTVAGEIPRPPTEEPATTPQAEDGDSIDEDADEEAVEDDDPNKLWCICRKPHDNRFMICCDKCDDWFHGKCVGITKTQAKKMEAAKIEWHCPTCKKITLQQQQSKAKVPARMSSRRGSETSRSSTESALKVMKEGEVKKGRASEEPMQKRKSIQESTPKPVGRRKSESVSSQAESEDSGTVSDCIVCGKKSRKDSIFCSDVCISHRANATSKPKENPVSVTPPPAQSPAPPTKLKRLNSLKADPEKEKSSFFDFHVIQAGAAKSTEVVPAKQREPTTPHTPKPSPSIVVNSSTDAAKVTTPKTPTSPTKQVSSTSIQSSKVASSSNLSVNTTPAVPSGSSKVTLKSAPGKDKHITPSKEKSSSTPKSSKSPSHAEKPSVSSTSKEKRKAVKDSPKEETSKEKDPKVSKESEALMKENIRKTLRETFKNRLKDLSELERAQFPSENTPEIVAEKIEEELGFLYGSTLNSKYKTKYRSIYFNLRDGKNFLFREILQGTLSPKNLVKMESSDMASAELAEWRNRENQKNLDMIKRAEIDKIAEARKQALLDKGAEIDAVVAEEQSRKLDISDIIQTNELSSEATGESDSGGGSSSVTKTSKSHTSSSHHRSKDKKHEKHKDSKHNDKSRHSSSAKGGDSETSNSSKDRRSDKHRHRNRDQDVGTVDKLRKDSDSSSKHTSKDKGNTSSSKESSREERKHWDSKSGRDSETNKEDWKPPVKSDVSDKATSRDISEENSPSSASNQSSLDSSSHTKPEEGKYGVRQSIDSEQELPSSTIKTPDFTEEKKEKGEAPVLRTKLMMHELGQFRAAAYHVSHNSLQGVFFPESPVPIVGRISPETVWDYLDKMKKTKEVIVLRLAPETEMDKEGYMTFFSYLSSRGRLGVMGGITSPLKDVYLIPLDKHSPVNRALLPFRGPGLPKDRSHCLLAVVTRHVVEIPSAIQPKRKTSADVAVPNLKKKRTVAGATDQQQPTSSSALTKAHTKPLGLISESGALTDPRRKKVMDEKYASGEVQDDDDDDQPYTPWEDEDDKDVEAMDTSDPAVSSESEKVTAQQRMLEEIELRIKQQKQEIEFLTVGIKMNENNSTLIPGLDGDFPNKEFPQDQDDRIPFFLKTDPSPGSSQGEIVSTTESSSVVTESNNTSEDSSLATDSKIDYDKSDGPSDDAAVVQDMDVEDDQAYSPSAVDFSDDEKEVVEISDAVSSSRKDEAVSVDQDPDEIVVYDVLAPSKEEPKRDVIPGLDLAEREEEHESPDVSGLTGTSTVNVPEVIELDDDEPPPPGEFLPPSKITKPSLDSVFSLPPPSYLSSKPKIQINLVPKMASAPSTSVLASVASSSSSPAKASSTATVGSSSTIASPSPLQLKPFSASSNYPSNSGLSQTPPTVSAPQFPPSAPPPVQRTSLASSPQVSIPPPGLASLPPVIPSGVPPSALGPLPPSMSIPPPGVIYPSAPLAQQQQQPYMNTPPPGYPVQRPSLIPAPPPVGGINVSVPPPGTVGMVPVTSIPPLPPLRGMPSLTPRFGPGQHHSQNNSSHPGPGQMGRFRPMNRFSQSKIPPSAHSPPGSARAVGPSSSGGAPGFGGNRRNYGHMDKIDGVDNSAKPNNYKGADRYRNRSYGNRHRSRSRSPVRNRSRSRSRERRRRRRHSSRSRSRSRSPARSTSRRRSRSRSPPQTSSRYSRSKSPPRRYSRSRSPSSSKNRRRKSHSSSPPPPSKSSSAAASVPTTAAAGKK